MKKLGALLLASALFGLGLLDAQPAAADCGKMMVVYYVWPSPPPPPPRPLPRCYVPPTQPRPQRRQTVHFQNDVANSTWQNAGRDANNVTIVNNGNLSFNSPAPLKPPKGREKFDGFNPMTPIDGRDYDANDSSNSSSINYSQWFQNGDNNDSNVNVGNDNQVAADNQIAAVDPVNSVTGFSMGPDNAFTEPEQQGVLAWNGRSDDAGEELLILSTNEGTTTGQATAMLSVLPLPGAPISVERASLQSFVTAKALLQSKLPSSMDAEGMGVVLETKIGSHNIFVWEVESSSDFQGKVQSYVADKYGGKAAAVITQNTVKVIEQYLKEGFRYFAFDLTIVEGQNSTKEAIAYRFKSKYAYFPLRISQIGGVKNTLVDLVVLTPKMELTFTQRSAIQGNDDTFDVFGPVDFSAAELKTIDDSVANFFRGAPSVQARSMSFSSDSMDAYQNDFEVVAKK